MIDTYGAEETENVHNLETGTSEMFALDFAYGLDIR